ncbi:MAG: hypothetical protein H6670_12390 [Anaerolineaceae bacterium]|nr:hypothetical protein [Anaerolineaceae bacterium]
MTTPTPAEPLDLALAVEAIYANAQFRRADSYPALVSTWADERPVPTLEELEASWQAILEERAIEAAEQAELEQTRADNAIKIDLDDYRGTSPQIQALASKVAWLEAELRDLRHID